MDHRKVLQTQIDLMQGMALASVLLIFVVPELILIGLLALMRSLFLNSPTLPPFAFNALLYFGVPLVMLFVVLIPIAVITYHRIMVSAALYATLLNIDENLEKLTGKARQSDQSSNQ